MSYYSVENFVGGLDLRKSSMTSIPGTLRELTNAHITPGGEIEKRKAFTSIFTLPAGTTGLTGVGNKLFVYRHVDNGKTKPDATEDPIWDAFDPGNQDPDAPQLAPVAVETINGNSLVSLIDWDIYNGVIYSVFEDTGGVVHHFYGIAEAGDPPETPAPYEGFHVLGVVDPSGRYIRTFKTRMNSIEGKTYYWTGSDTAINWDPGGSPAGGLIVMSTHDGYAGEVVGIEIYYDQLIFMSRYSTQFWNVDTDTSKQAQIQVLRGIGTIAPKSLEQFAGGDVLFLSDSGVRSLRARNSSNAASITDVGSPIDSLFREYIEAHADNFGHLEGAQSLVDPVTGRFWLLVRDKVYVLSYYPGPKITGWSTYELDFYVVEALVLEDKVAIRGTPKAGGEDQVYMYGGIDGQDFDTSKVTVTLPFLDAGIPATPKHFSTMDAIVQGTWKASVGFDPNQPAAFEVVNTVIESTPAQMALGVQGRSTHIAIKMECETADPAILSSLIFHFSKVKAE